MRRKLGGDIVNFIIPFKKDKIFSEYPCVDYLHNALRFLSNGEPDVAYEEICHALIRSGAELQPEEMEKFKKLRENHTLT